MKQLEVTAYVVTALGTAIPLWIVLSAFSQISPHSAKLVVHILDVPPLVPRVLFVLSGIGAAALPNAAWTLQGRLYWALWSVTLTLVVCSATLLSPSKPCLTMPCLTIVGPALLYALRELVLKEIDSVVWCRAQCMATAGASSLSMLAWITWIAVGFPGRERWFDWPPEFGDLYLQGRISWKFSFILWSSAPGCSVLLALLAVVYWVRLTYLSLHTEDDRNAFIGTSVKQLLGCLVAVAMTVWIGASLSITAEREDMRDETIFMACMAFLGLGLWMRRTYGEKAVFAVVGQSSAANEALAILESSWVKAFILMVGAVPLLVYAATYGLYSRLRGSPKPWPLIETLGGWHWTDVIVKALWLIVLYVFLFVAMGKATIVVLAVTNETISSWPVMAVSLAVFLVALALFMFPSTPGGPIYVLMGVVIVHSAESQGWSSEAAVAWATLVSFVMKLTFTAAAQKWIGEPMGKSDWVQQCIRIHTPYMRAVEQILQEETSVAKVALLVGGPDWPIAVLCGILELPVASVLWCVSPVLVQSVFPSVLAGALLYWQQWGNRHKDGDAHVEESGLAEVALVIAGFLQLAVGLIAALCVQETLEANFEQLSARRPQDEWLHKLDELDEARERRTIRLTSWEALPNTLRLALCTSLLCAESSLVLLVGPWHEWFGMSCFLAFDVMSSVEKDLGGRPLAIVQPLGWVALALAALSSVGLGVYYSFLAQQEASAEIGEATPLLNDPMPGQPSNKNSA
mmetsp:Transcript_39319/g.126201  ORF Transcript_39319/g.126201 Transcript_39319/m.126201 type:complete len:744 (+) Transcript_39319:110-2341(+)